MCVTRRQSVLYKGLAILTSVHALSSDLKFFRPARCNVSRETFWTAITHTLSLR
jgi:hypothetical protein